MYSALYSTAKVKRNLHVILDSSAPETPLCGSYDPVPILKLLWKSQRGVHEHRAIDAEEVFDASKQVENTTSG